MEKIIPCEECGHLVKSNEYYQEHELIEEHYECPKCGFRRHWSYGHLLPEDSEFKLSAKAFAAMLDGRQYGYPQLTKWEKQIAKENGLIVVHGASDDLMEFLGALEDEAGCFDGGMVYFNKNEVCQNDENKNEYPNCINAIWASKEKDKNGKMITWTYETKIPHETFMIYSNDEPYCKGIVFNISDIQ